jgi:hypothetical protein
MALVNGNLCLGNPGAEIIINGQNERERDRERGEQFILKINFVM